MHGSSKLRSGIALVIGVSLVVGAAGLAWRAMHARPVEERAFDLPEESGSRLARAVSVGNESGTGRGTVPVLPREASPATDTHLSVSVSVSVSGPGAIPPGASLIPPEMRHVFESERKDPDWSGQMESQLLGLIAAQPELRLSSIDVDCRETICRLRLAGTGVESDAFRALRYDLYHPALAFDQILFLTDPSTVGAPVVDVFLRRGAPGASGARERPERRLIAP